MSGAHTWIEELAEGEQGVHGSKAGSGEKRAYNEKLVLGVRSCRRACIA